MKLNRTSTSTRLSQGNDQKGAVLVLVAMLVTVIIGFAALAIDLSLSASSREQSQHYARLAALAAIEGHLASEAPSLKGKLADALERAKSVSSENVLISNIGLASGKKEAQFHTQLSSTSSAKSALLEPGVWYREDDGNDPCGDLSYPCFIAADVTDDNALVTAYRVSGSMYSGITTRLGQAAFGIGSFPINVLAVASIVPRHGCFLVDLSLSMTRETHLPRTTLDQENTPELGHGRESVFLLESENPAAEPEDYYATQHWNYLCRGVHNDGNAPAGACTHTARPADDAGWEAFLGFPVRDLSERQYSSIHFHSDYKRKKGIGDSAYDSYLHRYHPSPTSDAKYKVNANTNDGLWYRIDSYRDNTYLGPEPLRSVFTGVNRAIAAFESRHVAGDKLCLVAYNSRMAWTGVVKPTEDFDYLRNLTNFEITSEINEDPANISNASLVDSSTAGFERMIRYNLLPAGVDAFSTDTVGATFEALALLKEANPDGVASGFIVGIGDGLFNCAYCLDPKDLTKRLPGCVQGCSNTLSFYQQARKDMYAIVNNGIDNNQNIPIHWLMIGAAVAPHTLNITSDQSDNGECLSDHEARRSLTPMVSGGYDTTKFLNPYDAFKYMSAQYPFWEANVGIYEITAATQGVFAPIRPASTNCQKKTTCDNSKSRIAEDPQCRSMQEQIDAYMQQIMQENPFALVAGY